MLTNAHNAPVPMTGDATFSMMAKALYLITRLGLPPLILAHVTLAEYGLWSACFILVGYIGMADLGFSSVYVRGAARMHVCGDTAGIGRLLSTGIASLLGVSVALFAVIAACLPALMDLLKIDGVNRAAARYLILGSSAVFLADLSLNAFANVLHGLQRFRVEQKVWMLAYLLEVALIVAFLFAGLGIYTLLLAFALRYAFSIACNVREVYRALPGLSIGPRSVDRTLLHHFLSFGLSVQASNFFAMALHSADRLIAGALFGPQSIALFDLGGKLPVSSTSIPSAISQMTMPAAARLSQGGQEGKLRDLYAQTTRSVSLVASVPLAFIAVFAAPLAFAWLGARAELGILQQIMTLAALGAFVHIITGPGSAVFRGRGLVGNEFVYHGLRMVCLALCIAAAVAAGGMAVKSLAIGLAAGSVAAACLYLAHNHRRLGLSLGHLLSRILFPGAIAFVSALALLALWHALWPELPGRWETLAALAAFGAAHCMLAAAAIWLLLDERERNNLGALTGRLGLRLSNWRLA